MSQREERAKTPSCREEGKSWYTSVIHPWLLEPMHVESPRSVSVRLGQRALACPAAGIRGTRLAGHRTSVESQMVGRKLSK